MRDVLTTHHVHIIQAKW